MIDELPEPPWSWGKKLLDVREADPPYDMLVHARANGDLDDTALRRWMMGFWLFYHVGVASWLAESGSKDFWANANDVAKKIPASVCIDGEWPRGGYRRYFRGRMAILALASLEGKGTPEDLVDWFYDGSSTFGQVEKKVRQLPTYGYTMAFKIADMGERVLGHNILFDPLMKFPEEPHKGEQIASERFALPAPYIRERVHAAIEHCPIPGLPNRRAGVQEIETIFCEWKHMLSGKFKIGQDGPKLRKHLTGYGDLASRLSSHLP